MTPREVFQAACRYLLDNDWTRDGDDPGLWSADGVFWRTIGQALIVQWENDGVSLLEEAS